jgi:hypothetical protein
LEKLTIIFPTENFLKDFLDTIKGEAQSVLKYRKSAVGNFSEAALELAVNGMEARVEKSMKGKER